jgi:hypothetical protein
MIAKLTVGGLRAVVWGLAITGFAPRCCWQA